MGTLKEFIEYMHKTSGVQYLVIAENRGIIYIGTSNSSAIEPYLRKKIISMKYSFRSSAIDLVVGDELP